MFDWKPYYRRELESPDTPEYLERVFVRAERSEPLAPLIAAGAVPSFPHTALRYAAPLQARVITGMHQAGIKRVIALGVFHAWGHASSSAYYKKAMDETKDPLTRSVAFSKLKGAFFLPVGPVQETPFGPIPILFPSLNEVIHEDAEGLLKDEFSLDTFLSLLAFYYRGQRQDPPAVIPLYVGMTRDPVTSSFAVACQIADAIRTMLTPNTAVVATGDLVHYGTAYTPKNSMRGMPTDNAELTDLFKQVLKRTLETSLMKHDHSAAFERCDGFLNNDQRYLLPVVAEFLGPQAEYELLSFELSDYSEILNTAKPCVVASSLVVYGGQVDKRTN